MFYTYAHYTPEGRLFYIGKGTGDSKRAYDFRHRNDYWQNVVAKYGKPIVKILAVWDEEWKAFRHEVFLIKHFKGIGESLTNMTEGGEGQTGMTHWNKGQPWDEATKQNKYTNSQRTLKETADGLYEAVLARIERARNWANKLKSG